MKTFTFKKNSVPLWFTIVILGFLGFMATLPPKASTDPIVAYGILLLLGLLFAIFYFRSQTSKIVLSGTELQIFGDLTNFKTKLENLELQNAKIINLKLEKNLHAILRTWGVGLPKYVTGWFQLSNSQTGFLFVTDDTKVVHIPTKDQQNLLLSLENPEEFMTALKTEFERSETKLEESA